MTRVGVAIVHYRAEELCAECVQRLRASNLDDWSAVIVDNGSTTPLHGVDGDPRIRVELPGRNLGYARGVNLALDRLPASTPYVLLLNADVLVEPETLGAVLEVLEARPDIGAATCRLLLPTGDIDPACRRSEPTAVTALAKQLGISRQPPVTAQPYARPLQLDLSGRVGAERDRQWHRCLLAVAAQCPR